MTITIQSAIEKMIAAVPGAPFPDTVDTIKTGDPAQEITSVAVTFLASIAVIEQAASLGANFIITHEPTFYNHLDATDWLTDHPVYQAKRALLEEHGLVIWRFHDYLHSIPPDNTVMGMAELLGWEAYRNEERPYLCTIPEMTLAALRNHVAARLGRQVQVVGDMDMPCAHVAILPGFPPVEWQIGALGAPDVDVLITGEIHEWETSEYVRDATHLGLGKGLIVAGHAASEEPGMQRIIPWLQAHMPGVTIHYLPTGSPFHNL